MSSQHGAVAMFYWNGVDWEQEAAFLPDPIVPGEVIYFGSSVAILDSWAFVNAPGDTENGGRSGAVYAYRMDEEDWILDEKVFPSDSAEDRYFGWAVAAFDNWLLVGSGHYVVSPQNLGAAYLFQHDEEDGWQQRWRLTGAATTEDEKYGYSVGIWENWFVVGAHKRDCEAEDSGAAYLYSFDEAGHSSPHLLYDRDGEEGDRFGYSVAMADGWVFVGAHRNDYVADDAGAVFVYWVGE